MARAGFDASQFCSLLVWSRVTHLLFVSFCSTNFRIRNFFESLFWFINSRRCIKCLFSSSCSSGVSSLLTYTGFENVLSFLKVLSLFSSTVFVAQSSNIFPVCCFAISFSLFDCYFLTAAFTVFFLYSSKFFVVLYLKNLAQGFFLVFIVFSRVNEWYLFVSVFEFQ